MTDLGTRLSFLVIAWVMLAAGAHWSHVALVSAVQLTGYLAALLVRRRLSVYADVGSVAVVGAIAFWHDNIVVLATLAALLGALRGVRAHPAGSSIATRPPREALATEVTDRGELPVSQPRQAVRHHHRVLLALAGLAVGAAAVWLGPAGALWANAMIFAVSAVLELTPSVSEADTEPSQHRVVGRIALNLVVTNFLVQAAAVLLVVAWIRDVAQAPELLGLVAGAFALGMLRHTVRHLVLAGAALTGCAAVFLLGDRSPALLLIVVATFVAGAAAASVDPVVGAPLRAVRYLGVPVATAAAAWTLGQVSVLVALGIATGLYLVALLIPVLAFRDWRQLLPDSPVLPSALRKLPGRLTVTLVYANGQWLVEVRKGRALLGSRHLVKSNEALNMLALLEVPGVAESVEKALDGDKVEAARQAERVRNELSELESKLAGLHEMTGLNDLRTRDDASDVRLPDKASVRPD